MKDLKAVVWSTSIESVTVTVTVDCHVLIKPRKHSNNLETGDNLRSGEGFRTVTVTVTGYLFKQRTDPEGK